MCVCACVRLCMLVSVLIIESRKKCCAFIIMVESSRVEEKSKLKRGSKSKSRGLLFDFPAVPLTVCLCVCVCVCVFVCLYVCL